MGLHDIEIKDEMSLLSQINYLHMEVCRFIDEGKTIPVDKFENIMDEHRIVKFLREEYGFKNINCQEKYQDKIQKELSNICVSENEAHNLGIQNNGLVYLSRILFERIQREAFDYKWNYENLYRKYKEQIT